MSSVQQASPPAGAGGPPPADKPPSPFFPADNPAVIAHMNQLQGVINRLATQSTSCKTWCLTVVGGLLALAGSTKVAEVAWLALVPVLAFGLLDAFYIACERAFRDVWEVKVQRIRDRSYELNDTFAMTPGMNACRWLATLGSVSVLPYLALAGMCVLVRVYIGGLAP